MTELRKIDTKNIWKVVRLSVNAEQESFVASNTESILQAYTTISEGKIALPFAIYSEDTLVGFVMFGFGSIGDEDEPKVAQSSYCIWRLMIDSRFQGRGLGKAALSASLDYLRTKPCGEAEFCWLSYEPENEVAKSLYASAGFMETGEKDGEELVAVLRL